MRDRLRQTLEGALSGSVTDRSECALLFRVLRQPGMPLDGASKIRFGMLCLGAYEAVRHRVDDAAMEGAAAVELFVAAGCLFDNVIDGFPPDETQVNTLAGIALMVLSHSLLESAALRSLPAVEARRLLSEANAALLASVSGEYKELLSLGSSSVATDDAFEITSLKAGSFGRLAGQVGGRLAQAPQEVGELLIQCCQDHATYLQLVDDLADAVEGPDTMGPSDASQRKPTLPLVYLKNMQSSSLGLGASTKDTGVNSAHIMNRNLRSWQPTATELRESGAIMFTELAAETLRNRFLSAAARVAELTGKAGILKGVIDKGPHESADSPSVSHIVDIVDHAPQKGTAP